MKTKFQEALNLFSALCIAAVLLTAAAAPTFAASPGPEPQTPFTNVNVFDGKSEKRIENADVLVEGNLIKVAATDPPTADGPGGSAGGAVTFGPPQLEDQKEMSADEVAKQLANPNNSLASLTFKNQLRWYDGDLPGAGDQFNYTLLFQPVFPFTMGETSSGGKANLFLRPAVPFSVNQPTFDAASMRFEGKTALGDIGFDLGYGVTEKSGLLWAFGILLGIKLFFVGLIMIMGGSAVRSMAKE